MSTWYVASNLTPGDNSGLDMVPNPGDYTDLETDDNCLVMHNDQMMIYSYDETDAQAGNGISIVVPDGNATGTGRWIIKDISTQGQNGFPIPLGPDSDSDISFVNGTRTFTIEPAVDEFAFIVQGVKFIRDAADTVVIADTHGLHWIYYDETGTLQSAVFADLTEDNLILYNCLVSYLYWDATNNEALLVGDERHGSSMSPATHYHLHETYGSQYENGLQLSGFSVDGSGAAATSAQFDVNSGEIHDEDIEVSIPTEENATIDTFYKFGPGGPWFKFAASAGYPVADGSIGTRLDWNDQNGGDWQLVEVDSGKYVLTHYFATNNTGQPIIGIMGENTYNNVVAARAGAETELISLTTEGLPIIEYVAIATVIWQTNSSYSNQVAAIIRSTDTGDDYIDWRTTASLTGGGSSAVTHENLAGLLGGAPLDHYHLTGAQHDTLTDGSDADALHDHDGISENTAARHAESHTITSHSDIVDATGAQIEELTGSGDTNLHNHNTVNHTDTEAIITVADDGFTVRDSGGNSPKIQLDNSAGTPYVRYRGDASGGYTDVWTGAAWESSVVNTINAAVELYYNDLLAMKTHPDGLTVLDTAGSNPAIFLQDDAAVNLAKWTSSATVTNIQMWDGVSAFENLIRASLNGAVELYYNNLKALTTSADGGSLYDTSGSNPVLYFRDDADAYLSRIWNSATAMQLDLYNGAGYDNALKANLSGSLELYHSDNKVAETYISGDHRGLKLIDSDGQYGEITKKNTGSFFVYNKEVSGDVTVAGIDSGSAYSPMANFDPDGACVLNYDGLTTLATQAGGITVFDSDGDDPEVKFKDSSGNILSRVVSVGANLYLQSWNGAAWEHIVTGTLNGATQVYYNGIASLATTVEGIYIKDTSGSTPIMYWKDDASANLGRMSYTTTEFNIQIGATPEDCMTATINGSVKLYYNGTEAFETTAAGAQISDTSGATPSLLFKNDAGTSLYRIAGSATTMALDQWSGSAWETAILCNLNGRVELNYNDIKAFQTDATGISVYDTSGNNPYIYFKTDAGVQVGSILGSSTSMYVRGKNHGGHVFIQGENTAGDTTTCIDADPDGAVELYYNNIKEFETISGGAKATNSFQIAATTAVTGILDEDNMASDSSTALCTQQSIKAYADSVGGGGGGGGVGHNVIINGDMSVNQRAASYAAPTTGDYTLDRWSVSFSGDTIVSTITQDTDVPTFAQADHKSEYSLKIDCTTAEAAVAAGDYYYLTYAVEGNDISPYMGDEITLSYWIKSTKIGVYGVSFQNSATDRSYIVEHEILVTDTWEKKTETFTLTDSGTWLADEGVGMYVNFAMFAGSTAHGTADTWNATADTSTANQVNLLDNTANDVIISQVKLETGAAATQFVSRPQAEELALCQRYYEKSYSQGTYLGTTTTVGQVLEVATRNSGAVTYGQRFNHTKCKVPTMVLYSPVTGASGKIGNSGDKTGVATNVGDSGWAHCSITSGSTGSAANYHWSADAEL